MTTTTQDTRFTADDYQALPEGFPAVLIEGGFVKEAAPTPWHQSVTFRLATRLREVAGFERVLHAPTDVFLDRWNVLQPDVLVLPEGTRVAPGMKRVPLPVLVAEVLSPGTSDRDRGVKCAVYLRAGVGEVWLLDPDAATVEIRTREGATRHGPDDEAASAAVPGFRLRLRDLLA